MSVLLMAHDGPVCTLTINRPDKLNALNVEVLTALNEALEALESRTETGCAILTGAGEKAFVAGADIASMASMTAAKAAEFAAFGQGVCRRIETLRIPVIAAVNGFALGGGCEIALACDFIYASENAKLGQPEVNLGVIPGFGGTQRLARRVGVGRARELCYTGDAINASEGLRIGLVNIVVPLAHLLDCARTTAQKIACKGPVAIARCKRVLCDGPDLGLPAAMKLEADTFASLFDTADQKEGMAAFLAKRPAKFEGR